MLELKNIKKDYPAGGETVEALKGINLQFRKSEFVSILQHQHPRGNACGAIKYG